MAGIGYRPAEVRAMTPRDTALIIAGYSDQARAMRAPRPGAKAPSPERVADLFADLRARRAARAAQTGE